MYHKEIKNTLCLFGLVKTLGDIDAFLSWLDTWDREAREQALIDLKALRELERITRKELIQK